jgi:hypothetical protein
MAEDGKDADHGHHDDLTRQCRQDVAAGDTHGAAASPAIMIPLVHTFGGDGGLCETTRKAPRPSN